MTKRLQCLMWLFALGCAGCGDDMNSAGLSDPCSVSPGALVGCPPPTAGEAATDIENACWKMVQCGVLPVESLNNPDYFDCVVRVRGYLPDRQAFALACIGRSTCDDLRDGGQSGWPFSGQCFQFGNQP